MVSELLNRKEPRIKLPCDLYLIHEEAHNLDVQVEESQGLFLCLQLEVKVLILLEEVPLLFQLDGYYIVKKYDFVWLMREVRGGFERSERAFDRVEMDKTPVRG